jgi:dephospho-CoA kinase
MPRSAPGAPASHFGICIGLTGPNASGKGEVARFLTEKGFAPHSLSDIVREEATVRHLDHSRDNLIQTGTALRREFGDGVLAERILSRLSQLSVVDSIRNPGEIRALRKLPGFHLLGIDAPMTLRFERSRLRGRDGDGGTIEEFRRKEEKERADSGPGQQLDVCMGMADLVVLNDADLEDLRKRVLDALSRLGVPI